MIKLAATVLLGLVSLSAFCDEPRVIAKDTHCIENNTKCEFTVYLTSQISDPKDYDLVIMLLNGAKDGDVMTFVIDSPGGQVDTMVLITDSIHASKAHTISEVHGMAASAAAMIAQSTDELIVTPGSTVMFHEVQLGGQGTASMLVPRVTKWRELVNEYMTNELRDWMTKDELNQMFSGKEFWMSKKEVEHRIASRDFKRKARHFIETVLGIKHEKY